MHALPATGTDAHDTEPISHIVPYPSTMQHTPTTHDWCVGVSLPKPNPGRSDSIPELKEGTAIFLWANGWPCHRSFLHPAHSVLADPMNADSIWELSTCFRSLCPSCQSCSQRTDPTSGRDDRIPWPSRGGGELQEPPIADPNVSIPLRSSTHGSGHKGMSLIAMTTDDESENRGNLRYLCGRHAAGGASGGLASWHTPRAASFRLCHGDAGNNDGAPSLDMDSCNYARVDDYRTAIRAVRYPVEHGFI